MAQTNINIRVDEDLKKNFDDICTELGLNMTTAFNIFARAVVRRQGIPFEVAVNNDPFYSGTNQVRLRKSIAALNAGKGTVHDLIEVDDE